MSLTHQGVRMVITFPELLEALSDDNHDYSERIVSAKTRADLAQSEVDNDFPILHGFALMGAWSAFETFIEDLAAGWMADDDDILSRPAISKIKISLAKYMTLDNEGRLKYLVDELQRDLKVDLKSGATRFEPLLEVLGLGGQVDDRVRQSLFETQQIRNLLAHRSGIVDRRFADACPWLDCEVGRELKTDIVMFRRAIGGLFTYVSTILNRCLAAKNMDRTLEYCPPGFEGALNFDQD